MNTSDTTRVMLLEPLGDVHLELPRRFSARAMLTAAYGQESQAGDQGRIGLVIAAAWGLCWTGNKGEDGRERHPLPVFRPETDRIVAYGTAVLDHLIGRYGVHYNGPIWEQGGELVDWIMDSLPLEPEVAAKVNFTSPPEGASTETSPSGKTTAPDSPAHP